MEQIERIGKAIGKAKLERVRGYLEREGFTSMVLMRKDNFAWITTGGDNNVIYPSAEGMCAVVILPEKVYIVSQVMDGARIMAEEMAGLEAEYVPLKWYEASVLESAVRLAGERPVSDVVGVGECRLSDIYELHNPFFDLEIQRMKELGRIADAVMTSIALRVEPGMTGYQVQGLMLGEFAARGVRCDVALVGSDERIFQYRHPTACAQPIEKYVLMTPALSRYGLHCNLARSVYFGEKLPEEIERAYATVCQVAANNLSMLRTGVRYRDILQAHRAIFAEHGYEQQWQAHYPGGRVGYYLCQSDLSLDATRCIRETDAFEWFITVSGAKTAELAVKQGEDVFLASHTGLWPSRDYATSRGTVQIPWILQR